VLVWRVPPVPPDLQVKPVRQVSVVLPVLRVLPVKMEVVVLPVLRVLPVNVASGVSAASKGLLVLLAHKVRRVHQAVVRLSEYVFNQGSSSW
jgi:hypothetical protein